MRVSLCILEIVNLTGFGGWTLGCLLKKGGGAVKQSSVVPECSHFGFSLLSVEGWNTLIFSDSSSCITFILCSLPFPTCYTCSLYFPCRCEWYMVCFYTPREIHVKHANNSGRNSCASPLLKLQPQALPPAGSKGLAIEGTPAGSHPGQTVQEGKAPGVLETCAVEDVGCYPPHPIPALLVCPSACLLLVASFILCVDGALRHQTIWAFSSGD